jgi:hypothetical protein
MVERLCVLLAIVLMCTLVPADIAPADVIPIVASVVHHTIMAVTMAALPAALVDPLDIPIYGARQIAVVANMLDENGEPDERAAFHALEMGYIDADKFGRKWRSTPRRILKIARDQFQQDPSK